MKTINAATDLFPPFVVDLWGPTFSVRQPTRAVERKVQAALEEIENIPEDADDKVVVDALAELLDVLLEPLPDEDGKKTHAKTIVRKKYAAEEIGVAHIERMFELIAEQRAERPN